MLHRDKEEFVKVLEQTSAQTGFPHRLLEKDYYLTIVLAKINEALSKDLILKGGTCLNKIYTAAKNSRLLSGDVAAIQTIWDLI